MGVRDLLMLLFAAVWGIVVIVTALTHRGDVPPALWTVLGVGEGAIMGIFRAEPYVGRTRRDDTKADHDLPT